MKGRNSHLVPAHHDPANLARAPFQCQNDYLDLLFWHSFVLMSISYNSHTSKECYGNAVYTNLAHSYMNIGQKLALSDFLLPLWLNCSIAYLKNLSFRKCLIVMNLKSRSQFTLLWERCQGHQKSITCLIIYLAIFSFWKFIWKCFTTSISKNVNRWFENFNCKFLRSSILDWKWSIIVHLELTMKDNLTNSIKHLWWSSSSGNEKNFWYWLNYFFIIFIAETNIW